MKLASIIFNTGEIKNSAKQETESSK